MLNTLNYLNANKTSLCNSHNFLHRSFRLRFGNQISFLTSSILPLIYATISLRNLQFIRVFGIRRIARLTWMQDFANLKGGEMNVLLYFASFLDLANQ